MKLISDYWRDQNAELHLSEYDYGTSAHKIAGLVQYLAGTIKAKSAVDYGCGKAELSMACPSLAWCNYDPAIPWSHEVRPADFVVCSDVMEHVEADCVDAVLDHIHELSLSGCKLFLISLAPGARLMPDGSLAHCTVRERDWWIQKLQRYGRITELPPSGPKRQELVVWIQ